MRNTLPREGLCGPFSFAYGSIVPCFCWGAMVALVAFREGRLGIAGQGLVGLDGLVVCGFGREKEHV